MLVDELNKVHCFIPSEAAMESLGKHLADCFAAGMVVYLVGQLGVGKTTLARGILRGLGYNGNVRSPTYTLIEQYSFVSKRFSVLNHFDLYRLENIEELEHIGMRDYFTEEACHIIEWPEKAQGYLPSASLHCKITADDTGRLVEFQVDSSKYIDIITKVKKYIESTYEVD